MLLRIPPATAKEVGIIRRLVFGVLLGNALMLFTICLMLYAWVPAQWALVVSAMFALCLSPHMYWTNSY